MKKPLMTRRRWQYVDYSSFIEGTEANELPPLTFADWVPTAVADEARKLHAETITRKDPIKAAELLSKLVSDLRMKTVWTEFCKRKRLKYKQTSEYVTPLWVTNASWAVEMRRRASALTESDPENPEIVFMLDEAKYLETCTDAHYEVFFKRWTEQDLGVQILFWQVYHDCLDIKPTLLADIKAEVKPLQEIAGQLRAHIQTLASLRIECKALDEIASKCDYEARHRDRDPRVSDPWIITRQVNDPILRTLVAYLSSTMRRQCNKPMYGTIATIGNVVLDRNMTAEEVREMIRWPRD